MTAEQWVEAARQAYPHLPDDSMLDMVCSAMSPDADGDNLDSNEDFREEVCQRLNQDVSQADRALVVYLLEQEILSREEDWGVYENMKLCAYMLFKLGHVEDALLIWKAKSTNFDTFSGLDVQLLAGGGLDETIAYLRAAADPEAVKAAQYIQECRAAGDFSYDFRASLAGYFSEAGAV